MDEKTTHDRPDDAIRFFTHLSQPDDLTLLILKGHLLIEEQLIFILEESVRNVSALNSARLSFHKRLHIAKALKYEEEYNWVWNVIEKLNELRNELAHKIESPKIESKVNDFLDYMVSEPIYKEIYQYHKDDNMISRLKSALAFLSGVLSSYYTRK